MIEQRLTMDELGDAFGNDLAGVLAMGRFLEEAIALTSRDLPATATGFDAATAARGGLADRVMAALEEEPAPAPAGFLLPLRRGGFLGGLVASLRQAAVATRGAGRPLGTRVAALAYVLVLSVAGLSLTGAASLGAAGALGLLEPSATESVPPSPPPTLAPPTQPLPTPAPTAAPTLPPEASPSPTPSPSESPEESDDDSSGPGGGGDDNSGPGGGGNSGPGSSSSGDDSSGSGSGSGSGGSSGSGSGGSSGSGSGSSGSGSR